MNCPKCENKLELPALFIGISDQGLPTLLFSCKHCSSAVHSNLQTLKPYNAPKARLWPPSRGEYSRDGAQDPVFVCPLCTTIMQVPPQAEIPGLVCPSGCGFHADVALADWSEIIC